MNAAFVELFTNDGFGGRVGSDNVGALSMVHLSHPSHSSTHFENSFRMDKCINLKFTPIFI